MKVVHCLGWYLPESVGGTEIYVQALCRELAASGLDVAIMAPRDGSEESAYVHDGVPVVRYPVPLERDVDQVEGRAPHAMFDVFQRQLREQHADVFHIHSQTTGCGAPHLAYARELGLRTLMTVHLPNAVCARGTMLRFGREVCDGRIDERQCVPCWLDAKNVPRPLTKPLDMLLENVPANLVARARGPVRTLLRTPVRIADDLKRLETMAADSDGVVAVCAWLRDALLANGLPASKVHTCRQGVRAVLGVGARGPLADDIDPGRLRVAYFGRFARVKGLDLLVRAVRALPRSCRIALTVYAVPNADEAAYAAYVRELALGDPRIEFRQPLPNSEICAAMRRFDLVAIPSRWLETGPLVAMEALASGIPVLGTDLGGIRELVEPGRTGWLLPHDDVVAWSGQLAALARPGAARLAWDPGSTPVITQVEVARRMLQLYREVSEAE